MSVDMAKTFYLLRASKLFKEFPDDELMEILPLLKPNLRWYPVGTVVATTNSIADRIGIVESGLISSQHTTFSGNLHISALYDSGKLFGLNAFGSSPGRWPMSFIAEEGSNVLTFSMLLFMEDRMELQTIWRNLRIWRCIGQSGSDRWNRLDIRDIARAAPTARGKILTFFDIMQNKFGSNTFELRMPREQFADFLNINRSTLFRELGKLKKEGIIIITNERVITVNTPNSQKNL